MRRRIQQSSYTKLLPYSVEYEDNSIVEIKTEITFIENRRGFNSLKPTIKISHYLQWGNLRVFNNTEDKIGRRVGDGLTDYKEC
jgi:hypothetical protein